MRTLFMASVIALMAASGSPAFAEQQSGSTNGLAEVSAPAQPFQDPVICRFQPAPKSKMSMILCARRSEWARRTEEDREMLERLEARNSR
ncbi:MAG TPA: hypothetical protein VLV55_12410 [Rhizomicrobium sp.]|nr:hypothetical protein [Rhizomicrobium sp.]